MFGPMRFFLGFGSSRKLKRSTTPSWNKSHIGFDLLELRLAPALNFASAVNYAVGPFPISVAVGDFNGDGKPDLTAANSYSTNVSVLLANGNGTFKPATTFGAGISPLSVAVGDFNGDGKPDLATANVVSYNVSVLLGNGNGTFKPPTNIGIGTKVSSVAVADFNGDGKPDLAVGNRNATNVCVLLGNGDGTFKPATNFSVSDFPFSVTAGDLNGDGKPDLATVGIATTKVSVLLGNGDGTFKPAATFGTGLSPFSVAVGDFNGDGKPDLAVANYYSDNVSVLLGNGNGTFKPALNAATGIGPVSVAVGDFNGDGKPDLATADYYSSNASVLLGNGDGTFKPAADFGVGRSPYSVAVGDFNGDGKPDLTTANLYSDDVSVLLNSSTPTTGTAQFTAGSKSVTEGSGSQTVAVSLTGTGSLTQSVTVTISAANGTATSGSDYSLTTTSVTFAAGTDLGANPTQNVTLTLPNDQLVEGSEIVTLTIGAITATSDNITTGATASTAVTIGDDDSATVSISSGATVSEGGAASPIAATLRVTTNGVLGGAATLAAGVIAKLAGNSDYTSTAAPFAAGAGDNAVATFTVSTTQDPLLEGPETFANQTLTLTGPASASGSGQTITVNDDESATLAIATTSTVIETGGAQPVGAVTLTITGTGTGTFALGSGVGITADVTQTGGTATSGTDYSAFGTQTVTFSAGDPSGTAKAATLTATADQLAEGNETVVLSLGNLANSGTATTLGNTSNTTTITDVTVTTTFVGPTLVIADATVPGRNNGFKVSLGSANITVAITDSSERFVSAPTGWSLSADNKSISRPVAGLTGSIRIDGSGGDDRLAVDGGGSAVAIDRPDASVTGSGSIDLSNGPFSAGVHFIIDFANIEPVDISGMALATLVAPANSANAFALSAGFDSETGSTHPAIVVSGTTGAESRSIGPTRFFSNSNVFIDASATTGTGPNTIAVNSAIPLGHDNANLTLKTNAGGSVTVNSRLTVGGILSVMSSTASVNADLSAATLTGTATIVNLVPAAELQDGVSIAASGAALTLAPGTYAGNVALINPVVLTVASETATITGGLSGAAGLTKGGNGTLVLSGVNTYQGNTSITRGRLQINNDNQLGNSPDSVSVTTPGVLEITGDTTSSRTFFLNNNSSLQIASGKTLTLSGAEIDGGFLSGPGAIATSGSNPTFFTGTRTTSSLTLNANVDATFTGFDNGGTLTLAAGKTFTMSVFTNTSSGKMFVNGAANVTDFVTNGQINVTSAGSIVNVGPSGLTFGSGRVTTVDSGGLINLGASSAILAGALMINNGTVGSVTPGVTLVGDFGGVAKGTGLYVSILTQNGGVFSPGASPGTGTTSQWSINGGGTFRFEIANATGSAGAPNGWDRLTVEHSAYDAFPKSHFTATPANKFNIAIVSLLNSGDHNTAGPADNFDPQQSYSWKFLDASDSAVSVIGTFDPAAFNVDASGFATSVAGDFSVASNDGGRTLSIVYTPLTVVSSPQVSSVTPNGNLPGFAGDQRSRVVNLTVVFDQPVDLDANALMLFLHTNNVTLNGVSQPNGFGVLPTSLNLATTDKVTWVITFIGNTDDGIDGYHSLQDGVYDLTIDAAKVHPLGVPGVTMADNQTTTFHRLFGDNSGAAMPFGNALGIEATVNTGDNLPFRNAFNRPAGSGYEAFLDFNGDGVINSADNLQFRARFNKALAWIV